MPAVMTTPTVERSPALTTTGFASFHLVPNPPIEHNENQGNRADTFGNGKIVKRDLDYAVRSEGHAQQYECQQHGYSYLVRDIVEYNAQYYDYCAY